MKQFHPVPGGYCAEWEAPEIEAFAAIASEILVLFRLVVDGAPRSAAPSSDMTTADAEIPAKLDFAPAGDLARQFDLVASGPTNLGEHLQDSILLRRLLPPASKFDENVNADFRYLARTDIAKGKAANFELLIRFLLDAAKNNGRIIVPTEQAGAVAAAFTDLRLTLAIQLGVEDEEDAQRLEHEAELWAFQAAHGNLPAVASDYQFLASVYLVAGLAQESLVESMLERLENG